MLLNIDTLNYLRNLGEPEDEVDFLTSLIDVFCEDSPKLSAKIRGAIEAGNSEQLEKSSHRLKGSAGELGALNLRHICAELEVMGRSRDFVNVEKKLEDLAVELELVCDELQKSWRK